MATMVQVDDEDLRLALGYLRNLASNFTDIPKGLNPTFYHTLSYDGDVAEGERLRGVIKRLEDRRFMEAR
jgi:hypothetical protein